MRQTIIFRITEIGQSNEYSPPLQESQSLWLLPVFILLSTFLSSPFARRFRVSLFAGERGTGTNNFFFIAFNSIMKALIFALIKRMLFTIRVIAQNVRTHLTSLNDVKMVKQTSSMIFLTPFNTRKTINGYSFRWINWNSYFYGMMDGWMDGWHRAHWMDKFFGRKPWYLESKFAIARLPPANRESFLNLEITCCQTAK